MVVDKPKVTNVSVNNIVSYDLGVGGLSAITVDGNYEGNITPPAKIGDIKNISFNNIISGNKTFRQTVVRVDNMAQNVWVNDIKNYSNKPLINEDKPSDLKITNIK